MDNTFKVKFFSKNQLLKMNFRLNLPCQHSWRPWIRLMFYHMDLGFPCWQVRFSLKFILKSFQGGIWLYWLLESRYTKNIFTLMRPNSFHNLAIGWNTKLRSTHPVSLCAVFLLLSQPLSLQSFVRVLELDIIFTTYFPKHSCITEDYLKLKLN